MDGKFAKSLSFTDGLAVFLNPTTTGVSILAISSAACFSVASIAFGYYGKSVSVFWMTAFKALVALLAFGVVQLATRNWQHTPALTSVLALVVSGFIGLNLGDLFLVRAFSRIGSSRTLMIFSFEPAFLAVFGYLFFSQNLNFKTGVAILFLMACAFVLSYEKFRSEGKWEVHGPLFAITGTFLDCLGILLSRYAFNFDPELSTMEGNFFRCLGAALGFWVISIFFPFDLWRRFRSFSKKSKTVVILASFLGTFVSLSLYLGAIRYGHLATVSALLGAGPVLAAVIESVIAKKRPSRYLILAFVLFVLGFVTVLTQ